MANRNAIAQALMAQRASDIPSEFSGGLGDWQRYLRDYVSGADGGDGGSGSGVPSGGGVSGVGEVTSGSGVPSGGGISGTGIPGGGQGQSNQQTGQTPSSIIDQGFNTISTGAPDNPDLAASLAASQAFTGGQSFTSDPNAALGIGSQGQGLYGSNPGNNPYGGQQQGYYGPSFGSQGPAPYGTTTINTDPYAAFNQAELGPEYGGYGGYGGYGSDVFDSSYGPGGYGDPTGSVSAADLAAGEAAAFGDYGDAYGSGSFGDAFGDAPGGDPDDGSGDDD